MSRPYQALALRHLPLLIILLASLVFGILLPQRQTALLVIAVGMLPLALVLSIGLDLELALLGIVSYMAVEPFILKFVPDQGWLIAKYWAELVLYALFARVILNRILNGRQLIPPMSLTLPIVLFFVLVVFSSIANEVQYWQPIAWLRFFVRYLVIVFIISEIKDRQRFSRKLMGLLYWLAILQLLVGGCQLAGGETVAEFFRPRLDADSVKVAGLDLPSSGLQTLGGSGRLFGTLGRYDQFGEYLGLIFCFAFPVGLLATSRQEKAKWIMLSGLLALFVLLSFSRQSIIAVLMVILLNMLFLKKIGPALAFALGVVVFVWLVLMPVRSSPNFDFSIAEVGASSSLLDRLAGLFDLNYINMISRVGRVSIFSTIVDGTWRTSPIWGAGPLTVGYNSLPTRTFSLIVHELDALQISWIGDVGWASVIAQSGFLGALLLVWLLGGLFSSAVRCMRAESDHWTRAMYMGLAGAVLSFAIWGVASSPFESRYPAFYFWLLTGSVLGLGISKQQQLASATPKESRHVDIGE